MICGEYLVLLLKHIDFFFILSLIALGYASLPKFKLWM